MIPSFCTKQTNLIFINFHVYLLLKTYKQITWLDFIFYVWYVVYLSLISQSKFFCFVKTLTKYTIRIYINKAGCWGLFLSYSFPAWLHGGFNKQELFSLSKLLHYVELHNLEMKLGVTGAKSWWEHERCWDIRQLQKSKMSDGSAEMYQPILLYAVGTISFW